MNANIIITPLRNGGSLSNIRDLAGQEWQEDWCTFEGCLIKFEVDFFKFKPYNFKQIKISC